MSYFLLQSILLLLLCFVIGYLVARFFKRSLGNRVAVKTGATPGSSEVYAGLASTGTRVVRSTSDTAFSANIKPDNLQIIEGIGPKMESVLNENEIKTWAQLAAKTIPEIQGILDKYGNRYQIIDPTIWREQARLAAMGKVDDLIKLQKIDGVSKLENLMNEDKKSGFSKYQQDDLKIVEGIGPKIEMLLNNAGINTWETLSKTELSAINIILRTAGPRYYRLSAPDSWSIQAKFAANGEWSKLKQFQDKLREVRPTRIDLAPA